MRLRALDLLACPECGGFPLRLAALEDCERAAPEDHPAAEAPCRLWCAALERSLAPGATPPADPAALPCAACNRKDILEAALLCPACGRWFAVRGGIADLTRDDLRLAEEELEFLARWRGRLPTGLAESAPPFNLARPPAPPPPEAARLLDEGRYWGAFMEVFWNLGDRAIFDVRARASHPAFLGQGVREVDDRDLRRRVGFYPEHLARILFDWFDHEAGSRALDIGCGGGQYGLEAARRGLDVYGMDPSRRALELARLHAIETDAEIQYLRALPGEPPFRPAAFDVLLAKDSLHHIPDLPAALDRLCALLPPGGRFAAHEHVGRSPRKRRIVAALQRRLLPRIQRRYGAGPAPAELLAESPNEDAGMERVEPELRARFDPLALRRELFLYHDAEALFYFAFGKRRLPAFLARAGFAALERLWLALGEPAEHLAFRGRKPGEAPAEVSTEAESKAPPEEEEEEDETSSPASARSVPGWPRLAYLFDQILTGLLPFPRFRADWSRREKGAWGEYAAARALHRAGYRALARNVRLDAGEIDLLCDDGGTLVFVEVKTRMEPSRHPPLLAVNRAKMKRLRAAAGEYLRSVASPAPRARIDLVAVSPDARTLRPVTLHRRAVAWIAPPGAAGPESA